jgi:IclR family acetate operon transcriptional repressor
MAKLGRKQILAGDDKYYSKVVGKALDLLEILKKSRAPIPLGDLTREIGLAKSSVFRILYTLEAAGYVDKDVAGHYQLSPDIRPLVPTYFVQDVLESAVPGIQQLQREFPETISLGVLFDNHIEVVSVAESPQRIRMGNTVGRIIPPHASSLGKVLTAHQDDTDRDRILRSYGLHAFTPKTVTDEVELRAELETVKTVGFATDAEENTLGGCCLGAPIRRNNEVVAAISVSMPSARFPSGEGRDALARATITAADTIAAAFSEL